MAVAVAGGFVVLMMVGYMILEAIFGWEN